MSDDTLSERAMLAVIEANEVIFRISEVNDFIEWAKRAYGKVDAIFADGAKYTDHELYEARINSDLAERKAQDTGNISDLITGYKQLIKTCRTAAGRIQKEEIDNNTSFRSLIPGYKRGIKALLTDAKKYVRLAKEDK